MSPIILTNKSGYFPKSMNPILFIKYSGVLTEEENKFLYL
jgi:hypothetical protein